MTLLSKLTGLVLERQPTTNAYRLACVACISFVALFLFSCNRIESESGAKATDSERLGVVVEIHDCYAYTMYAPSHHSFYFKAIVEITNNTSSPIVLTDNWRRTYFDIYVGDQHLPDYRRQSMMFGPTSVPTGGGAMLQQVKIYPATVWPEEFFVAEAGETLRFPMISDSFSADERFAPTGDTAVVRVHFDPIGEDASHEALQFALYGLENVEVFPQESVVTEPFEVKLNIQDGKLLPPDQEGP